MNPTFSVVIPVYNKERYVKRAVESALRQDVPALEVIAVDDGSTDGSLAVLRSIAEPRLRVLTQANGGESAARNSGMAAAVGEWIAFLDADDMWLPGHLAELASLAARFPGASLVASGCREITEGEKPPSEEMVPGRMREVDYFIEAALRIGFVNASSACIKRHIVGSVGGFGGFRAGSDLEFWARVAIRHPVAVSDRVTAIYFRGTGGVMEQLQSAPPERESITSLQDVSPSVAFLQREAIASPGLLARPGIRAYVNSRIISGMRGSLARGDVATARDFSRLLLPPLDMGQVLFRTALQLPAPVWRLALIMRRQLRAHAK